HSDAEITITAERDFTIEADAFHFTNIVYNLIDNSIKYCDGQPLIQIRLAVEKNILKLEFTDNGIGVPQKKLSDIFDKFYRIPSTKSNEVNGFGLGLYYVKKICLLHGWKIKATNNTDKGLIITISIPNFT